MCPNAPPSPKRPKGSNGDQGSRNDKTRDDTLSTASIRPPTNPGSSHGSSSSSSSSSGSGKRGGGGGGGGGGGSSEGGHSSQVVTPKAASVGGRDVILAWTMQAFTEGKDPGDFVDSGLLPRLDSHLGSLLMDTRHLQGELGMRFQTRVLSVGNASAKRSFVVAHDRSTLSY